MMKYRFTIFTTTETLATFETNDEDLFNSVVDALGDGWASHVRIRMNTPTLYDKVFPMEQIP